MTSAYSANAEKIASKAINLMEAQHAVPKSARSLANAAWFTKARFGLFVHYGLYSTSGRSEWAMDFEKIPAEAYNMLAGDFLAEHFDAEALAALAKRSGAGYVVPGERHHDGFCLWSTSTSNFNSVKSPARRDLIREYVDACRRAARTIGLRFFSTIGGI